jgi:hypothetical protein
MMFFQIIVLQIVLFVLIANYLVSYKIRTFGGIPVSVIARDMSIIVVCLPCLLYSAYVRLYAFQPDLEYEGQTAFVFFSSFVVHTIASGLTTTSNRDLSGVMPSLVAYTVALVSIYSLEVDHTVIKLAMWALTTYVALIMTHLLMFVLFKRNFSSLLSVLYMIAVYTGMTFFVVDDFYRKQLLDIRLIAIISAFVSLFYPIGRGNEEVNAVLTHLEPFIQTKALGDSTLNQIADAPVEVTKLTEEEIDSWIKQVVEEGEPEPKKEELPVIKPKPKPKPKLVINTKTIKKKT